MWHVDAMILRFLTTIALLGLSPLIQAKPLNILLITADDLNWDSLGCTGCKISDITPHIDRLASQGMLFREAHSTVTVCQPVRATMSTGLYTINSGCLGFQPIRKDVTTMNEVMHRNGYLISMLAKTPHYQPFEKWCVDYKVEAKELMVGRSPEKFREHTRKFLALAAKEGKPFFHHVNCQDPHRPFLWHGEKSHEGTFPPVTREIRPDEVEIPGFLEKLPEIRQEVADYFTCVHRLDQCVGAVLDELKAAGHDKDTLVLFYGGDHGMSFPFAKSNTYENSSRGSLIVRWPGVVPAGKVDDQHMIATIDIAPTLLDAAGLPPIKNIDGRSFLPIARGGTQEGRDKVFTMYHETFSKRQLQMRCVRTRKAAYIWNAWSDGKQTYRAENMSGKTWKAMLKASETDPKMKARCEFYLKRVPQEYYRLKGDPTERRNLINDPEYADEIATMRKQVEQWLKSMNDPLLPEFQKLSSKK